MQYFQNVSSVSGGFTPNPHRGSALDPAGDISSPDSLICPPLEKKSFGRPCFAPEIISSEDPWY